MVQFVWNCDLDVNMRTGLYLNNDLNLIHSDTVQTALAGFHSRTAQPKRSEFMKIES